MSLKHNEIHIFLTRKHRKQPNKNRIFFILIFVIDVCMKFTNFNNIQYILKVYKKENKAAYLSKYRAYMHFPLWWLVLLTTQHSWLLL